LIQLRCECSADVAAARITDRWGSGDLSEATVAVADRMQAIFASWPEASEIDTSSSLAAALAQLPLTTAASPRVASRLTRADASTVDTLGRL